MLMEKYLVHGYVLIRRPFTLYARGDEAADAKREVEEAMQHEFPDQPVEIVVEEVVKR